MYVFVKIWIKYWRHFATLFLLIILFLLLTLPKDNIDCYSLPGETLPDISDATLRKGKSIFFHETSCKSSVEGKITITSRQACAVESAARNNPHMDVYLLYTSPGIIRFEGEESDELLKVLLDYKNVKIMHLNYERYITGTPVEELYTSGKIQSSKYVVSHASDVLRYLTLWKYGGIYLDLDLIILKSLENLPPNYAGLESVENVAAGVISFDNSGEGHAMAERCVYDLRDHFSGSIWGYNGPGVITRLSMYLCGITRKKKNENIADKMVGKHCGNFTVHPPSAFYPLSYEYWQNYFLESQLKWVIEQAKNSYSIHTWNKLSQKRKIPLDSNAPYLYFAKQYCPNVVEACVDEF